MTFRMAAKALQKATAFGEGGSEFGGRVRRTFLCMSQWLSIHWMGPTLFGAARFGDKIYLAPIFLTSIFWRR